MRPDRLCIVIAVIAGVVVYGCRKRSSPAVVADVLAIAVPRIPLSPDDAAWASAPEHQAALLPQDMVEPRLVSPSTPLLRVRALTDGRRIAFRIAWSDATKDDLTGAAVFSDACAVQLPVAIDTSVPDPQMGQPGRPVEITMWSARWQAETDNPPQSIRDIYPNAAVDHYPFESPALDRESPDRQEMALRYAPARALGNAAAGPRRQPVQDLIAEGPGTIAPNAAGTASGLGRRTSDGWVVVIVRDLPRGLSADRSTHVAFAVWDGARHEVGSRKMRSAWIPLRTGKPHG